VEEWQIARFCGKGGSNVRHIQGDSRARVFVPREWAKNKNVVVVGYPAQVDVAKKHVARILQVA
jgi:rRNA processing protein Krr1/Pno1